MELLAFAPVPPFLAALLFAGTLVGHLVLLVASHNYWYGKALPPLLTDFLQVLHGLGVLAGPPLFVVAAGGFDLCPLVREPAGVVGWVLAVWLVMCWLAAVGGRPMRSPLRVLRRRPNALLQNTTTLLN